MVTKMWCSSSAIDIWKTFSTLMVDMYPSKADIHNISLNDAVSTIVAKYDSVKLTPFTWFVPAIQSLTSHLYMFGTLVGL